MTAIAFVASATQQSATATVVVNKPSGGTTTDIFVAHWSVLGNVADANMTLPSGWVQVGYLSPTGGPTVKLAYKVAVAGSEPNSYTFTLSAAAQHTCGISRWSNVDTGQLSDAYVPVTQNSATSGTSLTALDIVPESDNAVLIAAFANSIVTDAITIPTGFSTAHATTAIVRNTVAYASQATAGHSNDQVATQAATAGWTAILWAMRPLDLGTPITVTVGAVKTQPSKLELGVSFVTNGDYDTGTFRTNFLAQAQGVYYRCESFIGGFGMDDPMYNWDGTGTVPSTPNELRGGVNVFNTAGLNYFSGVATGLGVPIDWIVWRLPWQFTYEALSGVNDTHADYYGSEGRRLRADKTADFETYLRYVSAYLISRGARRFQTGSEWKGLKFQGPGSSPDYSLWDWTACYDFYLHCRNGILLGADDAHVSRSLIQIASPYILSNWESVTTGLSITTDSFATAVTPSQTIRFKDDAVPPTWNINKAPWGNLQKMGARAAAEFLKLCVNNNTPVDMFSCDFGTWGADLKIKRTDDFANAEEQTRDIVRWARRMLQDVGDGRFANIPLDIAEYYIKPEGTIAQTTNTLLSGGGPVPGPFLPANQYRSYFAALKAIGLAVCVEEGVRTPYWWSPFDDANGRTTPQVTGGSGADKQAWYGESFIHKGATANGETGFVAEGDITAVGLVNKMFNTDFAVGTQIRAVTISDPTKVYALPNLTKCLVVNKTAGRKNVIVNGFSQTLAPYDTQEVVYASASTLVVSPAVIAVSEPTVKLARGRRLTVATAAIAVAQPAVALRTSHRMSVSTATVAPTLPSVNLKRARTFTLTTAAVALTLTTVRLVQIPPIALIADPAILALTPQPVTLTLHRTLTVVTATVAVAPQPTVLVYGHRSTVAASTVTLTAPAASLVAGRVMASSPAIVALTAPTVQLRTNRRLTVAVAAIAVTPQDVALLRGRRIVALALALAAASPDVALLRNRHLSVAAASIGLTAPTVNLNSIAAGHFLLTAATADVAVSQPSVTLTASRFLRVAPAAVAVTAGDVLLSAPLRMTVATAIFTLSPQITILGWSSAPDEVAPLDRALAVIAEYRIFAVAPEDNMFTVEFEDRTFAVKN